MFQFYGICNAAYGNHAAMPQNVIVLKLANFVMKNTRLMYAKNV